MKRYFDSLKGRNSSPSGPSVAMDLVPSPSTVPTPNLSLSTVPSPSSSLPSVTSPSGSSQTKNKGKSKDINIEDMLRKNADPGKRISIEAFDPNIRDEIRRRFLEKGPCQPEGHNFPWTDFSGHKRRFVKTWFKDFDWLEYSVAEDAAYCLVTYSSRNMEIKQYARLRGLSMARLRGQGYDGASNMQGEFSGLRTRIEGENKFAFYIHCFAHQLQLALVGVTNKHNEVGDSFVYVSKILNVVGASCKRKDILLEKHYANIVNLLEKRDISSGRGLNQEINLRRHGNTRCGSHYITLLRLSSMFYAVIESLEIVREDGAKSEQRTEAGVLLDKMCIFEFVFILHLMKKILRFTNEISQALQRKDQDIENAMRLVAISKERLRNMREDPQ